MRTIALLFILLAFTGSCFAQLTTFFVPPQLTDPGYSAAQDSHVVTVNGVAMGEKLYLWLGGTGSSPENYRQLRDSMAAQGFDLISLSYPNGVAAASLASSPDSLAFDHYRQEICFGTEVSPAVNVDSLNSIVTRLEKLLAYLDATFPQQLWGQYMSSPGVINWEKVTIGGHSQGSGHAAYLGKFFALSCVHMFAGPNDYSDTLSGPAHWFSLPGQTPVENHFGYLSLNDEVVPFWKQFENLQALGLGGGNDSVLVDNLSPPYNNGQILYTEQGPGLLLVFHNAPVRNTPINHAVWRYMGECSVPVGVADADVELPLPSPNPASQVIRFQTPPGVTAVSVRLYDMQGQLAMRAPFAAGQQHLLDVSQLPDGIYLLQIGGRRTHKIAVQH